MTVLNELGLLGVWLSLFIEGSALPFVGTVYIITIGFIKNLSWLEMMSISLLGSFLYAVGSYIPYWIGFKLGDAVENKVNSQQFAKAKQSFHKYGMWTVAISSPLPLGNVIPFLAGMTKMKLLPYTLLTMLGIAPTTFLFLSLGQFYDGSKQDVLRIIDQAQWIAVIFVVIIAVIYIWKKRRVPCH